MVDILYRLHGANGEFVVFDGVNYVLNQGFAGFGIAPTTVRIEPSAGQGGVFRHSRRGVRDVDLPITVLGTSRDEVQDRLRKLARITQDRRGPMTLQALYSDGEQLNLHAHYTGGAESMWGQDSAGMHFCRWVLSLQAPNPFWESANEQEAAVIGGNTGRGLLPQLTRLKVSSSTGLGEVVVTSTADVEVYPVWTITGPIDNFTVSDGLRSFTIEGTIGSGESMVVDAKAKTVTDQDGVNQYARLAPAPKLFPFEPGETTLEVTGTNTDEGTSAVARFALNFEVVH